MIGGTYRERRKRRQAAGFEPKSSLSPFQTGGNGFAARKRVCLGSGLINPHPQSNRCEGDGGEKIPGEFVVARGDASEVFELAEEALDQITLAIEAGIDRSLDLAVALGRNMGLAAAATDQINQVLPVISAIGDDDGRRGKSFDKCGRNGLVGRLSWRESEADRQSALIDDDMDLAGQSSTRAADGVIRAPFLPPAACWWARTMELSINCIDCGEAAARASKTCSHTPALAHRL